MEQQVNHKPKHSVEDDVESFIGWKKLLEFVGKAENPNERNLIAFTFETGGRISEVLQLRTDMFRVCKDTEPKVLIVEKMPLSKRYKKVKELRECSQCHFLNELGPTNCAKCSGTLWTSKKRFETEKLDKNRKPFVVFCNEPLTQIMLRALVQHIRERQPFIFLNKNTKRPFTRVWAYKVLRRVGDATGIYLYPHRLRAERASHLGVSLKAESLLEYFSWESWKTAKRYAKKGPLGLAQEMGATVKKT